MPMVLDNDRLAIQAAIRTANLETYEQVRLVRIKNTNQLEQLQISTNLLPELAGQAHIAVCSAPAPLIFGPEGNLE